MSTSGFTAPPYSAQRFCPYHGGFIMLADCFVVATNDTYAAAPRRRSARSGHGIAGDSLDEDLGAPAGAGDDDDDTEAMPRRSSAPAAARTRQRIRADLAPTVGDVVTSDIDGRDRHVLAQAPPPPQALKRRRFQAAEAHVLKSPAELAVSSGGARAARARPARACPICRHPLPATIDYRDPYPIAMVGHTQASKTSTVLALIESVGNEGPEALGVESFSPTELTSQYLRSLDARIFEQFRRGHGPPRTQRRHHPPLEFVTTLGDGSPATVLLHDVAGEDLMDPNTRLERAPTVLWADAIVFVYNPEDSPRHKRTTDSDRMDQAVILNGVRDDLESRGTHDPSNHRYTDPPLIIAVSKADLLNPAPDVSDGPAPESEVKDALRKLGDGAIVSAARRWPEVHWRFIAPQPPSDEPQGVIELFRLLLSLLGR